MFGTIYDEHRTGANALVRGLERTHVACDHCGFDGCVLHGEWKAHVERSPRSHHLCYRLTCPDCNRTKTVELNL